MTKPRSAKELRPVLDQLAEADDRATLTVDGHELSVTSLDKELWPGVGRRKGATKRDLLRYLARVSSALLPHLADRPLFVTRFPDGVTGKSFFQKHWEPAPPFARTVEIHSAQNERDGAYLICENLATLLWLGQMAGLELHAWFSRTNPAPDAVGRSRKFTGSEAALERSILNYPDFIVFDLDPYLYSGKEGKGEEPELNRRAFTRTRTLALRIREILEGLGLRTFVKTSGRTGLHLYLPIIRDLDFDAARDVAQTMARARAARASQGRDHRVGGASSHGQDLLRLQPEHAREVARGPLLPSAPSGRDGLDAARVGRAGTRVPDRLHAAHGAGPARRGG